MDVAAKDATDSAETVDVVDVTADADAATTDVDAVPTTDVAQSSGSYLFFAAAVAAVSKCPQHCHLLPLCSNNIS